VYLFYRKSLQTLPLRKSLRVVSPSHAKVFLNGASPKKEKNNAEMNKCNYLFNVSITSL